MPRKWILFRILNVVFLFSVLIIFSLMLVVMNDPSMLVSSIAATIITIICGAILLGFTFLNYLWLERYYPNNLPEGAIVRVSKIFFVLNIIVQSLLFLLFVFMLVTIFLDQYSEEQLPGVYAVTVIFTIMCILGIYLLIYQYRLRKLVTHNYSARFTDFLDSER